MADTEWVVTYQGDRHGSKLGRMLIPITRTGIDYVLEVNCAVCKILWTSGKTSNIAASFESCEEAFTGHKSQNAMSINFKPEVEPPKKGFRYWITGFSKEGD